MAKTLSIGGDKALALELPSGQTFDEWVELGRNLASANKVLQWWIGDWWVAGSHRYGERAKLAACGVFGREFETLANTASICRAFETSRRREHLSFGHHASVAALPPEQADDLLERAERDGWTVRDIRAEAAAVRDHRYTANIAPSDSRAEALERSALVGAWNRARVSVRELFLEELGASGASTEPVD